MKIYYFMLEAVPTEDNLESELYKGAFVNCWVKGATYFTALKKAKKHIHDEKWEVLNILEAYVTDRESYIDLPEALECYDEACKCGLSSIFYTWENDYEDEEYII